MLSSRAGSGDKLSPLQSGPTRMGHFSADAIGTEAKLATISVAATTPVLSVFMFNPPYARCFETFERMLHAISGVRRGQITPQPSCFDQRDSLSTSLGLSLRPRGLPGFEIGW